MFPGGASTTVRPEVSRLATGPGGSDAGEMDSNAPGVSPVAAPVRVLIVDDQEPFRLAARTVVQVTPGFELAGEASSGEEGVRAVAHLSPDLVLMDINMSGIDGIEATRQITTTPAPPVVILMSTYAADALPAAALETGAMRYVHKEDLGPEVLREVWEAAQSGADAPRPASS